MFVSILKLIKTSLFSILGILFLSTSCVSIEGQENEQFESEIDSFNNVYAHKIDTTVFVFNELDSVYRRCVEKDYSKGIISTSINIVRWYTANAQQEKALLFYLSNESRFDLIENDELKAKLHYFIGSVYFDLKFLPDALGMTYKAYSFYKNHAKKFRLSDCYNVFGLIYSYLGEYDKGAVFFERSVVINKEINDSLRWARDLHNLGMIQMELGNDDASFKIIEETKNINEAAKNFTFLSNNYNALAHLKWHRDEYDAAEILFNKSLESGKKSSQYNIYLWSLNDVAEMYFEMKDYERARGCYNMALRGCDSVNSVYLQDVNAAVEKGLYKLCYAEDDFKQALGHYKRFSQLSDSLERRANAYEIRITELKHKIEQGKSTREISLRRKNYFIYGLVVSIFVSFIILYLVVKRFKLKSDNYKFVMNQLQAVIDEGKKGREIDERIETRPHEDLLIDREYEKEEPEEVNSSMALLTKSQSDKVWKEFDLRFRQVHQNFYKNLSMNYPELTSNERRLAAFLLLNMTTKEISNFTGQSIKAIGQARTRLRKKLELTNSSISLSSFFQKFE